MYRMRTSRKKVTFSEEPMFLGSAGRNDIGHSGVLEHYHYLIVKHLTLTSPVYKRLKENGILTTEQIGLLELEESSDRKVAKLIDVLKSKDHYLFTTFCAVLHETGHHHLAQMLQKAASNKTSLLPEGKII
ncbi:caspase-2-like [Bufo bufo]|uniref:caspase-2-like n=1 Tax=Bufo bufo TaxID=8384 RepID=UPI001ABE66D5|nr:caspase-2-like [Bufo bufo]